MYLLDTNVVSEARKATLNKADRNVMSWIEATPPGSLYISAITLFEIELGILLKERRDPLQGRVLRRWMDEGVKEAFRGRMIAADDEISLLAAAYNVPDPRPLRDAFIGATAQVTNFTLVTRNVRDFDGLDIAIINPWNATGA